MTRSRTCPTNVSDEPRRASVSSRADGSIALLGSPSTARLGPTFRTSRCYLDENAASFPFVSADGRSDSVGIEIVGPTDLLSKFVQIVDD